MARGGGSYGGDDGLCRRVRPADVARRRSQLGGARGVSFAGGGARRGPSDPRRWRGDGASRRGVGSGRARRPTMARRAHHQVGSGLGRALARGRLVRGARQRGGVDRGARGRSHPSRTCGPCACFFGAAGRGRRLVVARTDASTFAKRARAFAWRGRRRGRPAARCRSSGGRRLRDAPVCGSRRRGVGGGALPPRASRGARAHVRVATCRRPRASDPGRRARLPGRRCARVPRRHRDRSRRTRWSLRQPVPRRRPQSHLGQRLRRVEDLRG